MVDQLMSDWLGPTNQPKATQTVIQLHQIKVQLILAKASDPRGPSG